MVSLFSVFCPIFYLGLKTYRPNYAPYAVGSGLIREMRVRSSAGKTSGQEEGQLVPAGNRPLIGLFDWPWGAFVAGVNEL